MAPVSPLCSRDARSQKTLVGRAQWRTHPGHAENQQYNEQAWKNYLWSLAAGFSDVICGLLQGCIPGVSKLFLNSLLG